MLPGQRLSACTCPGESHPGPMHQNGSFVGRSAPEIDLFEALIDGTRGQVSQSAQWAPFNVRLQYLRKNRARITGIHNELRLNMHGTIARPTCIFGTQR